MTTVFIVLRCSRWRVHNLRIFNWDVYCLTLFRLQYLRNNFSTAQQPLDDHPATAWRPPSNPFTTAYHIATAWWDIDCSGRQWNSSDARDDLAPRQPGRWGADNAVLIVLMWKNSSVCTVHPERDPVRDPYPGNVTSSEPIRTQLPGHVTLSWVRWPHV